MTAPGVPPQVVDGFAQASASGAPRPQPADRRRRPRSRDPRLGPGRSSRRSAVHRRDPRRRHPPGVQPRDRPDVLARRRAADRGGHRGRRHQGDPAPHLEHGARRRRQPRPAPAHAPAAPATDRPPRPTRHLIAPVGRHGRRAARIPRDMPVIARRPFPPELLARPRAADAVFEPVLAVDELPDGAMRRVTVATSTSCSPTPRSASSPRRSLPAHVRAPVDRRARRLHRRLPAARGPVRPGQRRPRADADDRRPRRRRRLPPDLVAGRRDPKVDPPGKKAEARRSPACAGSATTRSASSTARIEVAIPGASGYSASSSTDRSASSRAGVLAGGDRPRG